MTRVEKLQAKCRQVLIAVLYSRVRWPEYQIPRQVWRWWKMLKLARIREDQRRRQCRIGDIAGGQVIEGEKGYG